MASKRGTDSANKEVGSDDFAADLIKLLNREHNDRVAYNLATDLTPTHIKRWISTGSIGLDYIISNKRDGGFPEGRVVEIFGPPSIGKSHIAIQVARATQQMGGIVVYIDTENATQVENLENLGVDIGKRFVFCEARTIEEVFQIAERTIIKSRESNKNIPVTIIWDSVAGTPSETELKADYDDQQIGVSARAISKGMRKITQVIGQQNILFCILNQTRTAVGVMYGDPTVVPGGKSIPYHASVRIKLGAGKAVLDKSGNAIGINVTAKTVKNKVAYPFRKAEFEIHFGKGIVEHQQLFEAALAHCNKDGRVNAGAHDVLISGQAAWKTLQVWKAGTEDLVLEKKFVKNAFGDLLDDKEYRPYLLDFFEGLLVIKRGNPSDSSIDMDSFEEVRAAADLALEDIR